MVAPPKHPLVGTVAKSRISPSGQVTIPASIRRELGVTVGDSITFVRDSEGRIHIAPDTTMSLEEIMSQAVRLPAGDSLDEALADARGHGMVRERYRIGEVTGDSG